ncbi:aspercryptin biosynthesis cluster-specific transcription regulator atnN [Colletotrichum liriopes]|uniref:Aspercryptin biosynthesis cluster-specific transcription regulator atnN n=1 Tax=Colletotrichum liriopes TaxID=708192 RepID=A0AA37LPP7_9PEZI|nr:aspercryptin biosynthesis cluster-specific transcription regulator atnN [Colletotrichum liriopes]
MQPATSLPPIHPSQRLHGRDQNTPALVWAAGYAGLSGVALLSHTVVVAAALSTAVRFVAQGEDGTGGYKVAFSFRWQPRAAFCVDIEADPESCSQDATWRACDYLSDANNGPRGSGANVKKAYMAIVPRPSLNDAVFRLTPQTGRPIIYFQDHSVSDLAGNSDNDFWRTTVLQMSHREPCVHQMLIALGALHEGLQNDVAVQPDHSTAGLSKCAEEAYTTAVNLLNRHMEDRGWSALEVTLVCSVLGITFEWLRGTSADANLHLASSLEILATWLSRRAPVANSTSLWSPAGHIIRSQAPFRVLEDEDKACGDFSTISQARASLCHLLAYHTPDTRSLGTPQGKQSHRPFVRKMSHWSDSLTRLVSERPDVALVSETRILRLWHAVANMVLRSGQSREGECFFDRHSSFFTELMDELEELARSTYRRFSVDLGVIPLVYYVAVKCRHPTTRRRAVALLESSPRREAMWDSLAAARVSREWVRIEEDGLQHVEDAADVPAEARLDTLVSWVDLEARKAHLMAKRQGEANLTVDRVLEWPACSFPPAGRSIPPGGCSRDITIRTAYT